MLNIPGMILDMMKLADFFGGMPKCVGIFLGLKSGLGLYPCSRQTSEHPLYRL